MLATQVATMPWRGLSQGLNSRRWRAAIMLASLGVVAVQLYQLIFPHGYYGSQLCNADFQWYYNASRDMLHGVNPYLAALRIRGPVARGACNLSAYVYPPLFAALLTPLALLPLSVALALWDVCNVLFLGGSIYAVLRAGGARPALVHVIALTAVASLLSPVRTVLYWGQADLFMLFFMSAAFLAASARRPGLAGVLLGVSCVVKPTYLALVVFLLWKREFKFAAVTVLAFLAYFFAPFLWLGGQALRDEISTLLFVSGSLLSVIVNHAPKGVLTRLFTTNTAVHPLVAAPTLVTVLWLGVVAVVGVLTVALVAPRPLRQDARSLMDAGLVLLAFFLVSPMTEDDYLSMMVLTLLSLVLWLRTVDWWTPRLRWVALGVAGMTLALALPLHSVQVVLWNRMRVAPWPLGDVYMLLAAVYLYIMIAAFAFQLVAVSLSDGRSVRLAVRETIAGAPALLASWVRDARAATRTSLASLDRWWRRPGAPAALSAARWRDIAGALQQRRWRLGIIIACLAVVALQLFQLFHAQDCVAAQGCNVDFHVTYDAAVNIRNGASLYKRAIEGFGTTQSNYVYPPFFAILMIPLTYLPVPAALAVWNVCNLALLGGAIALGLRACGAKPSLPLVAVLTVAASNMGPVRSVLHWGQADLFILFFMSAAFLAAGVRRPGLAGVLLGVACVVKPLYLPLVVYLIWKREFKFAAATVLAFLVYFFAPFLWLGARTLQDELYVLLYLGGDFTTVLVNHAPKGVLLRLFTVNPYVRPLVVAPTLVTVLWLGVVAVVGVLTVAFVSPRPLRRDPRSLLEVGLVLLALFLVSPMTEEGHLSLLILPLISVGVWLGAVDWRAPRLRAVAVGLGAVLVLLELPVHGFEAALWVRMQVARPPLADVYMLLAAVYLYAMIALFALQLRALSLNDGRSIGSAVREVVGGAPTLLFEWLRDARGAAWASLALAGRWAPRLKLSRGNAGQ
jgi:Glycosyltransferase family 87